jgi:activator of 2-hydroxyglutaryl-CoA dehydratase
MDSVLFLPGSRRILTATEPATAFRGNNEKSWYQYRSSSIKLVVLEDNKVIYNMVAEHEGSFLNTLESSLEMNEHIPHLVPALVTGHEGRHLLNVNSVLESLCIERAIRELGHQVDAVASLGGEIFTVYKLDGEGRITTSFTSNKCASGTGEFFKQQLGRMDMTLNDISTVSGECKVHKMSSRCSVFMKSDCTHKLNKGEATKGDIVLSLSDVMAAKVTEFLKKAKVTSGKVLLSGGLTRNPYILRFIKEKLPHIELLFRLKLHISKPMAPPCWPQDGQPPAGAPESFRPHEISFGAL